MVFAFALDSLADTTSIYHATCQNGYCYFFGYFGVACALIFASTPYLFFLSLVIYEPKILEQPMELQKVGLV